MIAPEFLAELEKRRLAASEAGGLEKIAARHEKGLLTARERLEHFFDAGTFQEFGQHARHACTDFGMAKRDFPGDGVVVGTGMVAGRPVAAFSQDFLVGGGALGRIHAKKLCDLMDFAVKAGLPVVGVNDSGGARIQEGVDSLSGYGQVFYRNVLLSGVVPQIAVIAGPCAGGAAYSPALMDFLIMVRGHANMFICGPDVIKAATGENATMAQVGSADVHASVSGNIHFVVDSDVAALDLSRRLLGYLPSNNVADPPHDLNQAIDLAPVPGLDAILPSDPRTPMDVHQVIELVVDEGSFLEVQADFAKNLVVGFARVSGVVVGVIANQSKVKAGTLDIDASDKGARFIRTCNIFNLPLVTLVDVPGFLPGVAQERGGIIRHGAKMLFAYAASTVPKITVILRKAYGGAYLAMCSQDLGADLVFAWPTAEIAVMGADGATRILYKKEIDAAPDPKAREAALRAEYQLKFAAPWQAAGRGMVTDVIAPSETRRAIALGLRQTLSKRETRPPKKHGNIPL